MPGTLVLARRNIIRAATYLQRCCMQHLWSHCRRNYVDAEESDPAGVAEALSLIGAIHVHEKRIRKKKLDGPAKLAYRREHSAPAVDAFFTWSAKQRRRLDLLPTNPFAKALAYACEREAGLRVFLDDPDVSVDTNDLERSLRPIPTTCS